MTRSFLSFLCSGVLLLCGSLWAQAPRAHPPSAYVGSDTCQPCHDDIYKSVEDSAHGALLESRQSGNRGCESCHGPGSAHVNGNGDAGKIFRFTDAPPQTVRGRCGECHAVLMAEDANHRSRSCLDCHSAHHPQQQKFLLAMAKGQLCVRCH